jgi:uncharacterized protein YaiE (UPF0345 family)
MTRPSTCVAVVARAVKGWSKNELETAIVEAGGCAAERQSAAEWTVYPQGMSAEAEPLAFIAAPTLARFRNGRFRPRAH